MTLPEDNYICDMCGGVVNDVPDHYINHCPSLNAIRDKAWDDITDICGVSGAVDLFSRSDTDIADMWCGKRWTYTKDNDTYGHLVSISGQFLRDSIIMLEPLYE